MSKLKVYVAGPMSIVGPPTWNFPAFRAAAQRLEATGYEPVVPIEEGDLTDDGEPTRDWHEYLRRDIRLLMDCDAIALLPDWWNSRGARLEAYVANALEMNAFDAETLLEIPAAAIEAALQDDAVRDETVLEEAQRLIHGDRNADYGHPLDNHTTTAKMVGAYLRRKYGTAIQLDADDVCWFNVLQKVSREANRHKRDSLVDVCGYVGNVEMIHAERERRMAETTGQTDTVRA